MDTNVLNERKVKALEHIATSLDEVARLLVIIAENSTHPPLVMVSENSEAAPARRRAPLQPREKAE